MCHVRAGEASRCVISEPVAVVVAVAVAVALAVAVDVAGDMW
jgi:hypothetical protein